MPLDLTFWGVRGSIPTPVADNLGFGGNTACLTIQSAGQPLLIFDAGSGIRSVGNLLMSAVQTQPTHVHLFLTHFHWDHIQGLPYFAPIYHPNCSITIHSSASPADLEQILSDQMRVPYYPVAMPATQATLSYEHIDTSGTRIGDVLIRPFPLHHPNGATGYRVESGNAAVVYASDHEHGNPARDATLLEYAHRADILISDTQYTPEEYERRRGWGHSTWREAAQRAGTASVRQLILFHHDPQRTDHQLSAIVGQAQAEFEHTIAAKEGWSAEL